MDRKKNKPELSKRERQIMDIIYKRGNATASEIHQEIAEPPSYSTIRALLKILVEKGHLRHKQDGPRYVYSPMINKEKAKSSALKHLMNTFFDNSVQNVVSALLHNSDRKLSESELDRISKLIEEAKKDKNV